MRLLTDLDIAVVIGYLLIIFAAGMLLTRTANKSIDEFFVGGRHMPWWLIGISMAATNFSIDTPVSLTNFIRTEGIKGVWFFWSSAISALLVAFLFSKLWRRSGVMTDAEIIEMRYGGKSAAALRLFKGFYFGVIFNAFIMGWVFLAVIKVLGGLTDLPVAWILGGATLLVLTYTLASGFYGVIVTDFIQYFVALGGSITLAYYAVTEVGGLNSLVDGLAKQGLQDHLQFVPDFQVDNLGPISVFLTYLLVQWWAHKYADGGGKHIQRMLSARNEQHAFAATLLYAFINYSIQVWPWILTGLASLLLFADLPDPEQAYSLTMAKVLPAGLLGLVLASLIGAFMSTVDTHLNLGASYMINDIYRRFIRPDASDQHLLWMSRLAMVLLLGISILLALNMDSVAGAWKFLLTFAAGAGPVWIIRWYWWRVNAWSEFAAMIASGVIATWISIFHAEWLYSTKLILTVCFTAMVWIPVTLLTPGISRETEANFVARIRPGGPGWRHHNNATDASTDDNPTRSLIMWLGAVILLMGLNFSIGWLLLRS